MRKIFLLLLLSVSIAWGAAPTNNKIIYNYSTSPLTNVVVGAMVNGSGWMFHKGDIPSGKFPQVVINGTPVTTQADVKSKWSDGSIQFAILSYIIPSIGAATGSAPNLVPGSVTLTIQQQNTCHCIFDGSGTAQTQAQMLAAGYNFDATFTLSQPNCSSNGVCTSKTASARQMLTDGNYTVWTGGDISTSIILASDGPTGTVGKAAYDIGWERDANTWSGGVISCSSGCQGTWADTGTSLSTTATSIHVADAAGWTAPIDAELYTTNNTLSPHSTQQNAEHIHVATITLDSPSCTIAPCPATLSSITRHSDNGRGAQAYAYNLSSTFLGVYPDRWKEPGSAHCTSSQTDTNCQKTFRPRVLATFFPSSNQVKIRFVGEISSTQRYGDQRYSLTLTAGNTSPATIWNQTNVYQIAGTRWSMDRYDWCEALTQIAGGVEACKAGTVTSNVNHVRSVTGYTGLTGTVWYPKEIWLNGEQATPVVDHNTPYMAYAGAVLNYDINVGTMTEATLDQSWEGNCCVHSSPISFLVNTNGGMVGNGGSNHAENISGVTGSLYYQNTYDPQMGSLSPAMGGGGGGDSEDATGPYALWTVQLLFSMSQGADHGLRMFLKSMANANWAGMFAFHVREDAANAKMDAGDSAGAGTGQPVSVTQRPTLFYPLNDSSFTAAADRVNIVGPTEAEYCGYSSSTCDVGYWPGANHLTKFLPAVYYMTGDFYILEEQQFWGSYFVFQVTPKNSTTTCARGPTGAEGGIWITINQGVCSQPTRSSANILHLEADAAGMSPNCPTLSGGNCVPSPAYNYFKHDVQFDICEQEGRFNYTAGCNTTGSTTQKSMWQYGHDAGGLGDGTGKGDIQMQQYAPSGLLPLNTFNSADQTPNAGADCGYGMQGPNLGRAFCQNANSGYNPLAAHTSGATIALAVNTAGAGNITPGTIQTCSGCSITQNLQAKVNITNVTLDGSGQNVLTFASVPATWGNGGVIAVQSDNNLLAGDNYGALGVCTMTNVTATTVTCQGSSAWPTGTTAYPGGFYAFDLSFSVTAATVTALNATQNDGGGTGLPGIRIRVDSEFMYVCSASGTTVTLCPLDNQHAMRAVTAHFGHFYMMHAYKRIFDYDLYKDLESSFWLGTYYGSFWVQSLTDGTHTPRLDFNPYMMSSGRFPYIAPDGHTLTPTWAQAQTGYNYDWQKLNHWALHDEPNQGAYGDQMLGAISWAFDMGTTNASLAYNFLSTGAASLRNVVRVNDGFDAKWIVAPLPSGLPAINTTPAPPGAVIGVAYSYQVTTSNTNGTCGSWAVASGSLPASVSINSSTGLISGTPTLPTGTFNFTLQCVDATPTTITSGTFTIVLTGIGFTTTSPLPNGTLGIAYSQTLATDGGTAPLTFAVTNGSLPPGISLNTSTGALTGIPTIPLGISTPTITVTDSLSSTASSVFSITISQGVGSVCSGCICQGCIMR